MKSKKLSPQPNTAFTEGMRSGRKYGALIAPFALASVAVFVIWLTYRCIRYLIVHTR